MTQPGPINRMGGAGFQTCCIADFRIGKLGDVARLEGLETRAMVRSAGAHPFFGGC